MASPNLTFAVDSTGYVNVVAQTQCRVIQVFENDLAATAGADYLVQRPAGSASPITRPSGTSFDFHPIGKEFFFPGDIAGAVKTAAGSITMAQVEKMN